MKKNVFIPVALSFLSIFIAPRVNACGEITDLKTDIGTVKQVNATNYLVSIPEGTSKVKISANTEYDWVDNYGPREVSTNNKVELQVDGNRCGFGIYTYIIKFQTVSNLIAENTNPTTEVETNNDDNTNQNESVNENALTLSDLVVTGYEINFKPETLSYTLEVDEDVTSLEIIPTVTNSEHTVAISDNHEDLKEGENRITVSVVDSTGSTVTYELLVTRAKVKSNNNYLASILVNNYTLNFDSSQTTYSLSIGKESILNINVIPESQLATYEIIGNENLKDGSKIVIRVTAEDGSTRDYVININRTFNILDYWIYILIGSLIIILIVLLVIRNKLSKKKKDGPEVIEAQSETAGQISNIDPASAQDVAPVPTTPVTNPSSGLQIIEPTNIEGQNSAPVDEDNNTTEIFRL